jgi:predicted nucleotidyltransferase
VRPGLTVEDPILLEAVRRIAARFLPRRIVLFGSRARGDAGPDADYDLLVLTDEAGNERRLAGEMRWELLDLPASFDILVRPAAWWQTWRDAPFSLERRIDHEGVDLHVAP